MFNQLKFVTNKTAAWLLTANERQAHGHYGEHWRRYLSIVRPVRWLWWPHWGVTPITRLHSYQVHQRKHSQTKALQRGPYKAQAFSQWEDLVWSWQPMRCGNVTSLNPTHSPVSISPGISARLQVRFGSARGKWAAHSLLLSRWGLKILGSLSAKSYVTCFKSSCCIMHTQTEKRLTGHLENCTWHWQLRPQLYASHYHTQYEASQHLYQITSLS